MIPGILLAAGLSRRFGSQKLLIPFSKGLTIFEYALRSHLKAGLYPLIVVVSKEILERFSRMAEGSHRYRIENISSLPWLHVGTPWGKARLIVNEEPQKGMSESLKLGLKGLSEREKQQGVTVSLADMPKITAEVIRTLIDVYKGEAVDMVVPTYRDKIGHPVVFRELFYRNALSKIRGDKGLRDIIKANLGKIVFVPWLDDAVVADVDTVSDLNKIFQEGVILSGD